MQCKVVRKGFPVPRLRPARFILASAYSSLPRSIYTLFIIANEIKRVEPSLPERETRQDALGPCSLHPASEAAGPQGLQRPSFPQGAVTPKPESQVGLRGVFLWASRSGGSDSPAGLSCLLTLFSLKQAYHVLKK